jgi:hypothetical protein
MVDFDQGRDASYFNPPFVTGLPVRGRCTACRRRRRT